MSARIGVASLVAYKRTVLMEHVSILSEDEMDVLLRILGHDPAKMSAPLPDPTLPDEMDGIA